MADSGATSHAEGADNGNTGAASKAREAASAPASRSICLRRVISRPAAGVTGTAVPVAPTVPAAPAPAPAAPDVPTKPQVPVTVGNRTIKLPVGRSSVKNDLMTSLLSELLDEANEDDDDGDGDGATNDATNEAAGSGGGAPLNRLKPNTNFLTRLVSSAERSNRRIIAEVCRAWVPCGVFAAGQVTTCARVQATGLPQAKRKAKAKGKQLISKSFCTCRRRYLPPAVVNGMTNSLGPFCVAVCAVATPSATHSYPPQAWHLAHQQHCHQVRHSVAHPTTGRCVAGGGGCTHTAWT